MHSESGETGEMAGLVYALCTATALVCAFLLLRAYVLKRAPLLLWSGLCFVGLSISNALVIIDLLLIPSVDMYVWRNVTALAAMAVLLYGLIWNAE